MQSQDSFQQHKWTAIKIKTNLPINDPSINHIKKANKRKKKWKKWADFYHEKKERKKTLLKKGPRVQVLANRKNENSKED